MLLVVPNTHVSQLLARSRKLVLTEAGQFKALEYSTSTAKRVMSIPVLVPLQVTLLALQNPGRLAHLVNLPKLKLVKTRRVHLTINACQMERLKVQALILHVLLKTGQRAQLANMPKHKLAQTLAVHQITNACQTEHHNQALIHLEAAVIVLQFQFQTVDLASTRSQFTTTVALTARQVTRV